MSHALRIPALVTAATLFAGVTLLGCPGTLPEADKACFLQEDQAVRLLADSCGGAGCHGGDNPSTGLDLESPGVRARLVDQPSITCTQPLVDPGNPDNSAIYTKLTDPPPCGSRMPFARPEMYPEDKEILRAWIAGLNGSSCSSGTGGSGATTTSSSGTAGTGGSTSGTGASSSSGGSPTSGGTGATGGM